MKRFDTYVVQTRSRASNSASYKTPSRMKGRPKREERETSAEGRESRKAPAFLERLLLFGDNLKNPRPEEGSTSSRTEREGHNEEDQGRPPGQETAKKGRFWEGRGEEKRQE